MRSESGCQHGHEKAFASPKGIKYTPWSVQEPSLTRTAHFPTIARTVSYGVFVQQNRPVTENILGMLLSLITYSLAHAHAQLIEQLVDAEKGEHRNAISLTLHLDLVPSTEVTGSQGWS
jgi:hypothetical protein